MFAKYLYVIVWLRIDNMKFQVADLMRHHFEQLPRNKNNDTPFSLLSPPPKSDPLVKDEPEEEDVPDPPEINVPDEDSGDSDLHDDDEAMEELIANPTEVWN